MSNWNGVHADTSPLFYLDWSHAALVNKVIRLQKVLAEQQRAVDWLHKELNEQRRRQHGEVPRH